MTNSISKPNIVFIVLDTHRKDRLSFYGYEKPTSPNLDAFASGATVFETAVSPAQWTIPSHASMFSGEFPATHQTVQSSDALDPYFKTLAEWLQGSGYYRSGFCNNPLVGVLGNGLKRGFGTFYNYGGAVPSTPARNQPLYLKPLSQVWERYTQLLRKISYPIQNAVARSDRVFQLTLNPMLVPLWTRFANFKGNTVRSLADASLFLAKYIQPTSRVPHFLFLNLMETHLPFGAPEPFVSRFAPYFMEERAARDFMRVYNTQAMRWLLPMEEPFSALEAQTLSDLYDAEVAYQDHLLGEFLELLDTPYHKENTAVVIAADHGELLGEHGYMGHGLSVHEDLVSVPFVIRFPGQTDGRRIQAPVSTLQLFYTLLELAKVDIRSQEERLSERLERLSLARMDKSGFEFPNPVVSEAYAPDYILKIVDGQHQKLHALYPVRSTQRAVYSPSGLKLIQIEQSGSTLYDIKVDPAEKHALPASDHQTALQQMDISLKLFLEEAVTRQPENWSRRSLQIEDEAVLQRLRGLGYLE